MSAVAALAAAAALGVASWQKRMDTSKFEKHQGESGKKPDCLMFNMPKQWWDLAEEVLKEEEARTGQVIPRAGTKEHLLAELDALSKLYKMSDGDNWPAQWKQNWNDVSKGCNWGGVGMNGQWAGLTCHATVWTPPPPKAAGQVVSQLQLPHGKVKRLPDEMRMLFCTGFLEMPWSQIEGNLPDFHLNLCLQIFDLSHNKISGSIISDTFSAPCIQTFNLGHNQLSGPIPKSLRDKTVLFSLKLNNNQLTGEIPDFGEMPELRELDLSNNKLTGTIPAGMLGKMPKLQWLRLEQNGLGGKLPAELGSMKALSLLSVRGNDAMEAEVPKELAALPLRVFNGTAKMKCPEGMANMFRHVPESTACGGRAVGSVGGWMLPDKTS